MEDRRYLWKRLIILLALFAKCGLGSGRGIRDGVRVYPPTCTRIECPSYAVTHTGSDFEIRRYDSAVWMSTSPIQNISFVGATLTGFMQLFHYIQGDNSYGEKIEMTGPVITEVFPSDGPLCESNFTVSFYVPKANQADPPAAKGLHAQTWTSITIAVRQFSGFATDYNVAVEAAALQASLSTSRWGAAMGGTIGAGNGASAAYIVAQYNSPFEVRNRVNEIWMVLEAGGLAEM